MPQGRKKKCGPFRKPGSTNARDAISIPRINKLRASLETGDEETRDPRRLSCRSAKTEGATHLARGTETISFSNQDGFKRKRRRHKRPLCTACRLYLQLAQDKNGNLLVCEAVFAVPWSGHAEQEEQLGSSTRTDGRSTKWRRSRSRHGRDQLFGRILRSGRITDITGMDAPAALCQRTASDASTTRGFCPATGSLNGALADGARSAFSGVISTSLKRRGDGAAAGAAVRSAAAKS